MRDHVYWWGPLHGVLILWALLSLNEVGDELHILGHCTNKNIIAVRDTFLSEALEICPQLNRLNNNDVWVYLLNSRDIHIMRKMCKYVHECLELHNEEIK